MSGYNGSGVFNFTYSWANDAANGIPITASRMDQEFADATSGFNLAMTRDGQGVATAIIPFANGITIGGGQTLTNYSSGTWVPHDASGAGLSLTIARATYVRIGSILLCDMAISYPVNASASNAVLDGLPLPFANVSGAGGTFLLYTGSFLAEAIPVQNAGGFTIVNVSGAPVANSALSGLGVRAQFTVFTV